MARTKSQRSGKSGPPIEPARIGRRAKTIPRSLAVLDDVCRGSPTCFRLLSRLSAFRVEEIILLDAQGETEIRFLPPFNPNAERAARQALEAQNPDLLSDSECADTRCRCKLGRSQVLQRRRSSGYEATFEIPGLGRMARAIGSARLSTTYTEGRCVRAAKAV